MGLKDKKLIGLQKIDRAINPNTKQVDMALKARKEALEHVADVCGFVILYVIHMLRYVRDSSPGKQLPEVCYRV